MMRARRSAFRHRLPHELSVILVGFALANWHVGIAALHTDSACVLNIAGAPDVCVRFPPQVAAAADRLFVILNP